MQIDKSMISNLASDNQTYLYAAGQTPETSGKKKQRSRAKSEEIYDEGGDPDSDQSFTLAALDSQSFMRKITLQIIPAAISHNGTALHFWTLCFSSENLFHFKRGQTKYSIKPALQYLAPTILGGQSINPYLNNFFCYT